MVSSQRIAVSKGQPVSTTRVASFAERLEELYRWQLANDPGGIASELIMPNVEFGGGKGRIFFRLPNILVFRFDLVPGTIEIELDDGFYLRSLISLREVAAIAFLDARKESEMMRATDLPGQMIIHHNRFHAGYVLVDEAKWRAFLFLVNLAMT